MTTGSFEKNNLGWQIGQLQQKFQEFWELQTYNLANNIPDLSLPSWLDSPITQQFTKVIFWLMVAAIVIWLTWKILPFLRSYIRNLKKRLERSVDRTPTKLVKERSIAQLLSKAQKYKQQGNYREAIFCFYLAMLQRLNDSGTIPHQSSRTDGEYLQLIQSLPQAQPYQILFATHQQLCFGNAEASIDLLEQCQKAYQNL